MSRVTIIFYVLAICVTIIVCSPISEPHQIYVDCKDLCSVTCQTYPYRRKICPHICIKGFDCAEGYVLDTKNNNCVLPDQCPTLSG
ncbi:hypothetical protein M0802_000476 [Mischocyttarus mexicanus]|nr:hypothetical protein M0802_000476 [Mischocyttarus mexicanus]